MIILNFYVGVLKGKSNKVLVIVIGILIQANHMYCIYTKALKLKLTIIDITSKSSLINSIKNNILTMKIKLPQSK